MKNQKDKTKRYNQRKRRVKAKIFGNLARPRLTVSKSNLHIYAQIINDEKASTIVSASDISLKSSKIGKVKRAEMVGEELAKNALAKKIKKVVFDRNGFRYHGRIKALADGARKGGLEF